MITINRKSHVPLYQQLKEKIQDEIDSGNLLPNQQIPTEKELENLYNVSRTTVRQALDTLVMEGLLYRRQGIGTFVAEPKLEYALGKLTGFSEDIRRRGQEPGSQLISLEIIQPVKTVLRLLEVESGDSVIEMVRLRLANDIPVGIHKSYLRIFPHYTLEDLQTEMVGNIASIYRFLNNHGIVVTEGSETLEAVPASETEAELLGVEYRSPLLLVSRITYTDLKTPIEFCKMVYRADRYRYSVNLSV